MAYPIYGSVHIKKVSAAWEESAAGAGSGDTERQEDQAQEGHGITSHIVKQYFGDELLFTCYEFVKEMGVKPKSFLEVFEFLKFSKVKSTLKEIALNMAKRGADNG
jgi:hypothetical protein